VPMLKSPKRLTELTTIRLIEEAMVESTEGLMEEQDIEDFCRPFAREATQTHLRQKTPRYNMIFDPLSLHNRVKNKLYGRRCLKHGYFIQHKCYVDNLKKVHEW